jgi:hypothetical protein
VYVISKKILVCNNFHCSGDFQHPSNSRITSIKEMKIMSQTLKTSTNNFFKKHPIPKRSILPTAVITLIIGLTGCATNTPLYKATIPSTTLNLSDQQKQEFLDYIILNNGGLHFLC